MADQVESLVLEQLRLIREELASIKGDVREVKHRLTNVEAGQGTVLSHLGHLASALAQQQVSFDRVGERVERIESRLGLAEAGPH